MDYSGSTTWGSFSLFFILTHGQRQLQTPVSQISTAGPQVSISQAFPESLAAPAARESAPFQLENAAPKTRGQQRKSGFAIQGLNQTQNEKLLLLPDFLTFFSARNPGKKYFKWIFFFSVKSLIHSVILFFCLHFTITRSRLVSSCRNANQQQNLQPKSCTRNVWLNLLVANVAESSISSRPQSRGSLFSHRRTRSEANFAAGNYILK